MFFFGGEFSLVNIKRVHQHQQMIFNLKIKKINNYSTMASRTCNQNIKIF